MMKKRIWLKYVPNEGVFCRCGKLSGPPASRLTAPATSDAPPFPGHRLTLPLPALRHARRAGPAIRFLPRYRFISKELRQPETFFKKIFITPCKKKTYDILSYNTTNDQEEYYDR